MGVMVGLLDFYILEAGEYVDQLDALVGAAVQAPPESTPFITAARALRGSSTMAKLIRMAELAGSVERVGRGLRDGSVRWNAEVRSALVAAIDDVRILLRTVRSWSAAEEQRAAARIAELRSFVPEGDPAATASTPISAAVSPAFFASEVEGVAAALDTYVGAPTDRKRARRGAGARASIAGHRRAEGSPATRGCRGRARDSGEDDDGRWRSAEPGARRAVRCIGACASACRARVADHGPPRRNGARSPTVRRGRSGASTAGARRRPGGGGVQSVLRRRGAAHRLPRRPFAGGAGNHDSAARSRRSQNICGDSSATPRRPRPRSAASGSVTSCVGRFASFGGRSRVSARRRFALFRERRRRAEHARPDRPLVDRRGGRARRISPLYRSRTSRRGWESWAAQTRSTARSPPVSARSINRRRTTAPPQQVPRPSSGAAPGARPARPTPGAHRYAARPESAADAHGAELTQFLQSGIAGFNELGSDTARSTGSAR